MITQVGALDPDIAILTEVPRGSASGLARALGLHVAADRRVFPAPRFGNAVLAKQIPEHVRLHRLPSAHSSARRTLVVCRVGALTVAGFHLGLDPAERLRHAEKIRAGLPSDGPLLIGGDLNEALHAPAARLLGAGLTDVAEAAGCADPTYPAADPTHRIDVAFVRHVAVTGCEVRSLQGSDHRALVLTGALAGADDR